MWVMHLRYLYLRILSFFIIHYIRINELKLQVDDFDLRIQGHAVYKHIDNLA